MVRPFLYAILAARFLVLTPLASGQSLADGAKQLESQYKGKLLRVRYLLSDSKIRYDAKGNLVGKSHAGQWTWHSTIEVTKIGAKDSFLKIKANRLLLNYSRSDHKFKPVRSGSVEIEIETSLIAGGQMDLDKEWNKAFLTSTEEYPLEMQPYWRPFIKCLRDNPKVEECEKADAGTPSSSTTFSVAAGVTPPKVRTRVEPVYTEVARQLRITGMVLLEAIVRKTGAIEIVRIVRPLGFGLEENAAEALSQWTFEPGMRSGQAVDVALNIEVNFNLQR